MTSPHTAAAAALVTMAAPATVAAAATTAAAQCPPPPCSTRPEPFPPTNPTLPTPSEARVYVRWRLLRPCGVIASRRAGHSPAGARMAAASDNASRLSCVAASQQPRHRHARCSPAGRPCTARANAGRRTRCCGRAPFDNGRGTFVSSSAARRSVLRLRQHGGGSGRLAREVPRA